MGCSLLSSFSCVASICVAYLKHYLQTPASFNFRLTDWLIAVLLKGACTIFNLFNFHDVVITQLVCNLDMI